MSTTATSTASKASSAPSTLNMGHAATGPAIVPTTAATGPRRSTRKSTPTEKTTKDAATTVADVPKVRAPRVRNPNTKVSDDKVENAIPKPKSRLGAAPRAATPTPGSDTRSPGTTAPTDSTSASSSATRAPKLTIKTMPNTSITRQKIWLKFRKPLPTPSPTSEEEPVTQTNNDSTETSENTNEDDTEGEEPATECPTECPTPTELPALFGYDALLIAAGHACGPDWGACRSHATTIYTPHQLHHPGADRDGDETENEDGTAEMDTDTDFENENRSPPAPAYGSRLWHRARMAEATVARVRGWALDGWRRGGSITDGYTWTRVDIQA